MIKRKKRREREKGSELKRRKRDLSVLMRMFECYLMVVKKKFG